MTLLRSLIIGALAVAAARPLRTLLADRRRPIRRAAWILLLAPYFTPVLLTGYGYASFSLSLIHHPTLNTIFYSALLWWKFTPIAAVILYFTPAPISAEAIHCHRLISTVGSAHCADRTPRRGVPTINSKFADWAFLLRAGCAGGPVAALAMVFLFAFAEFEMASLMMVKSWTVALFDAHAGGLALSESLRRMLGPMLCEAAAVATAFVVLGRRKVIPARPVEGRRGSPWFAWCHLILALVFVVMIPAAMVLAGTIHGVGLVLQNFVLSREILASLFFASGASALAGLAAFWLGAAARGRRLGSILCKVILIAAVFAGLLGPLVLSLTVLAAFQLPGLISLRNTPVPLVFTLGLILLPMALVLKRVLELTRRRSALHLAALMHESRAARELIWRLRTSGKFWAMVLLFVWAYWDLTASAILAPIGMTPVTVRLYNLMHYGQIATLSAMTCAAFAAPILIFLLAFGTRPWWAP
jgi:iron(III) transport system permease protein